jgi:apolipoprotein N-acyltransferase
MAMLRGVENGYGVVRAARRGLLSVSDRYGRVVAVRSAVGADAATLAAVAPLGDGRPTPYARWGDWFGWLCVVASAAVALTRLRWRPADRRPMTSASTGDY